MLRLVLPTLRCFSRKLTRDELKEVLITTFLTGTDARWVEKKAQEFCERYWHKMMRPEGLRAVAAEIASGAEVTLCSASWSWCCGRLQSDWGSSLSALSWKRKTAF